MRPRGAPQVGLDAPGGGRLGEGVGAGGPGRRLWPGVGREGRRVVVPGIGRRRPGHDGVQAVGAGGEGLVALEQLPGVGDGGVEQGVVGQGGALLPLGLADLLGLGHQALGQGVGQVEGEGTRDDGGPGGGGHGGGDAVAPGPRAQVTEDRVLAGQLLVGGQVGGHEGQGVPPLGEDREVVSAQEDGHHGDDAGEQGPALLHVLATRPALLLQGPPLGDLAPGPEERLPDHVVKAFVDGQEEAAQPLGLAGRRVGPAGRHGPARAGGPR